ncbi:CUB and peptidase domain-containing protein 1-like [Oculina patagonica]
MNPSDVVVRMGLHNFLITDTAQELEVDKIIIHENYSSATLEHDIALLKLKTKATLDAGVGLVCLPDENFALEPNKTCYITGWGLLSEGEPIPSFILQEASVPIVFQRQCENSYPGHIHRSMICAGFDEGGVGACEVDDGGPMVCEFSGKWYLEGVTSWREGCARPGAYGVYANVRYLKSWVEDMMSSN